MDYFQQPILSNLAFIEHYEQYVKNQLINYFLPKISLNESLILNQWYL